MSAIAGIVWFHGAPAVAGAIEGLVARSASYGPDEQKCWTSGSVSLGHCMLRTTPEAADEHLPLTSSDGRYWIVWDGRLDNRDELRKLLIAAGERLRSDTDSELALHSYLVWGAACGERLLGDFAFAVWDCLRQSLFCIRDPMGARPLYWTRTNQFFAFATHEEALLPLPGVTAELYKAGIARYFAKGIYLPEESTEPFRRTWYENVRLLRAGELLEVDSHAAALNFRTYWAPEPEDEHRFASDAECQEAFLEVFGAATRARMRCTGDLAVLMSGGLDTAGIVAMLRRELRRTPHVQLHAYSALSDGSKNCVESEAILSLARGMGPCFHSISVPSFLGIAGVEDLMREAWPYSHPEDNDVLLQAVLCRAAARDGHRVIFQGANGDIATSAPLRYIAYLIRAGQYRRAWGECRSASRNHNYLRHESPLRLWIENLWTGCIPINARTTIQRMRVRGPTPHLLNRDFLHDLGWRADLKPRIDRSVRSATTVSSWHARELEVMSYSRSAIPRVAGRCGVETRDPWEDKRVVRFFLGLPLEYRVRHGWTKYLVRAAFQGDVDPQVLWRIGKQHLGSEFSARVLTETHERFRDELADPTRECWKYLDRGAAGASYERYRTKKDALATQDVFSMLGYCAWVRRMG